MTQDATDALTQQFMDHRELLFAVVYGMLGSVADTEDVLQDSWLAWHRRNTSQAEPVEHPRSYLVRVAINTALARQESVRRRRETYLGPWLPEPLVEAEGRADSVDREAVSLALLVVLQTLSPLERSVFVLHELFGFRHREVARILDRTPAATRQLGHRARQHVRARRPRYRAGASWHRAVTERFLEATIGGDLGALLDLLAPDVTMTVDGGGAPGTPRRPVHGRERVARLITGLAVGEGDIEIEIEHRTVNEVPGAVVLSGGSVYAVMVLDLTPDGEHINGVYTVINPDKLTGLRR